MQQLDTPDPSCFGCHWMCPCSSCHSHLKRDEWRQCLCVFTELIPSPPPLPSHAPLLSPPGLAGLWHPDRGSAWKQTAAAAPVTGSDRCAARCRVARRLEYRCMADRYHNHTSPLLSLTYWIKHLPSCSWISLTLPKIWRERDFLKCLWNEWSNMREVHDDTQQMRSTKLFLSQASPNRPASYLTVLCPRMLQLWSNYLEMGFIKKQLTVSWYINFTWIK